MSKIRFTKEIDVPVGEYCENRGREIDVCSCNQIRSTTSNVSWSDGLGSPGSITHYRCNAFGVGLHPLFTPWRLEKCEECLSGEVIEGEHL